MNNISNKTKETLINSLRNSDLKIIKKNLITLTFIITIIYFIIV